MSTNEETEMADAEIDEFLGTHETGVLSLADSDEPYSIPISYGYDVDERVLYMRLVSTPESEKRAFLASSPKTRFVAYDERDSTYRSVVVNGRLEAIEPSDLTPEAIEQYGNTKRPLFEIWAASKKDLNIELYRLVPDELSGRITEIDVESLD